jgi:hypothetical protein
VNGKAPSDEDTKRGRDQDQIAQKKGSTGRKEARLIKRAHDDRGEKRDKADMGRKKDRQTDRKRARGRGREREARETRDEREKDRRWIKERLICLSSLSVPPVTGCTGIE